MRGHINYPIMNYMTYRNSYQEDLIRQTLPQTNYLVEPQKQFFPIIPRYNGKPADLVYKNTPKVSRPLLLDIYGEEYENGRDLQIINTTNKRPVEVSGYFYNPNTIDKSPIKTTQEIKVSGIIL